LRKAGEPSGRRAPRFRLQAVQIVCGSLCVSRCAENRALVFAQHVEPVANVIRVVRAKPIRLPEILSREEVERLIQCANNPLHRVCILS
jgi:hypothetical protein